MSERYDIIGDVHGMIRTLRAMLAKLGYSKRAGRWKPPRGRKAVFVGDLIDRGPDPLGCLEIVMEMKRDGCAEMLLGNHEINALLYMARLRKRSRKNTKQFTKTLVQIRRDRQRWQRAQEFILRCPMCLQLDKGRLRVVHACWEHGKLRAKELAKRWNSKKQLKRLAKNGDLYDLAECCVKGPEEDARPPYWDKDGNWRDQQRVAWWWRYPKKAPTIVFGHYWFPWDQECRRIRQPSRLGPGKNAICVDFSAGDRQKLVAFRYKGRPKFVSIKCKD